MSETSKSSGKLLRVCAVAFLSLLALVVLAVLVLSWTIFTPSRLTKTAQSVMDRYVNCPTSLGQAKLSLVRTYPFLGFRLENLTALDVMEESPYDTLAHVGIMDVSLDFKALTKDRRIEVTDLFLQNAAFNMFTSETGTTNLDFLKSGDSDSIDSSGSMDLSVSLESLVLEDFAARYADLSKGLEAQAVGLDMKAAGSMYQSGLDARARLTSDRPARFSIAGDSSSLAIEANAIDLNCEMAMKDMDGNASVKLSLDSPMLISDSMRISSATLGIDVNGLIFNMSDSVLESASAKYASITGSAVELTQAHVPGSSMSVQCGDFDVVLPDVSLLSDTVSIGDSHITLGNLLFCMTDGTGASTDVKTSRLEASMNGCGSLDLSQLTDNIELSLVEPSFASGGESPVSASISSLALSLSSRFDSISIHAEPELSVSGLHLTVNGNEMVPDWPVSLKSVIDADRKLQSLKFPLSLEIDGQNLDASADLNLVNGADNASGTVGLKFSPLDIETLITMVPDAYSHVFDSISASGRIGLNATARGALKGGKPVLDKAEAHVQLQEIDAELYDTISVRTSGATVTVDYPSVNYGNTNKTVSADADCSFSDLELWMTGQSDIEAQVSGMSLGLQVKSPSDSLSFAAAVADMAIDAATVRMDTISAAFDCLSAKADIAKSAGQTDIRLSLGIDSLLSSLGSLMNANLGSSSFTATACYDESKTDLLQKWTPNLNARINNATLHLDGPDQDIFMPTLDMDFSLGHFVIYDSRVQLGRSDISLIGEVYNIGSYLDGDSLLTGKLYLESDFVDVNQIMELTSGIGKAGTVSQDTAKNVKDGPFLVPEGLDVTMHTDFGEIEYENKVFNTVGGDITVSDGTLVIQELGFSSNAAEMQLTAIYDTPSLDSLFLEMDFHLLDIEIDELISLIPSVDSVVPMLKSFDGRAQFHLAAESFLKPDYTPIMSTLMGAAAIEGVGLVVMDNEVFDGIKDKLMMSRDARNVIDSLEVELSVLRNKVMLYPFKVTMDKYTAVIGGRHNINKDLDCLYHIALINSPLPIRLGVSVSGPITDIASSPLKHISLEKPEYSTMFVTEKHTDLDDMIQGLRSNILNTLRSNVR